MTAPLLRKALGATLLAASLGAAACGGSDVSDPGPSLPACAPTDAAAEASIEAGADTAVDEGAATPDAMTPDASPDVSTEAAVDAPAPLDAPAAAPALVEASTPDAPGICDDNQKDSDETDIDCGGSVCPPCGLGQACIASTDCGSWPGCDATKDGCACDATTRLCVVDHCSDHTQDVWESAVDCGGGDCAGCAVGQACALDSDCASNACDLLTSTCAASHCSDHVQDFGETDVDCGGGTCPGCAAGKACEVAYDCADRVCDPSGTCE